MNEAVENSTQVDTSAIHAPEAGGEFLHNPETWIIFAFTAFMLLAAKYLWPMIAKGLDARATTIRDQLEQASRLRAEAESLLIATQKKQAEMLKEAENIITTAQQDAAVIRARAAEDLKLALDHRTQQAQEKISRAEAEAIQHIRERIIDSATNTARELISTRLQGVAEDPAIAKAIRAIEQQVH